MDDFGTCKHGKPFEVCFDCDGAMSDPMEDKSKCCQSSMVVRGKQTNGSTDWYECCACGEPCDVMEDKRLERSVEEIANYCVDGPGSGSSGAGRSVMKRRIVGALQAERDKLNIEVDRQTEKLCYENTTLQSQITALKGERDSWLGSKDGKIKGEHWEVVEDAAQTITDLQDQLTTIKELINGASLHPETGVSLVDDVRDLVKELARCKNSVPGSIKSYIAQVEHEKKEAAKLKAENSRLRELINEASGMMKLLDRKGQYESVTDWLAKAALDGTK